MTSRIRTFALLASSATLAACGGGGGGSDAVVPPPSSGPTADQAVVAIGPISNFGSVVVNGVRYNTDNAVFSVNGQQGAEADLSVGHIVRVKGTVDDDGVNGSASEVFYDDTVEGPVESIDLAAGTLIVLGQTVITTGDTSFDDDFNPESLEGINVGDIVEVSGLFDSNGDIVASRIDREDDDDEFEVHGFVTDLDAAAMTFRISDLVVDYSTATLEDFGSGGPENGDFVEVEGSSFGPNGELIAQEVDLESLLAYDDDDDDDDRDDDDVEFEIEGYITRFVSAEDFDVSGQPVTTNSSTEFEYGSAADLALNVRVEVEGELDASGVLVADEVEFEDDEPNIRIDAAVDAVDPAAGTVTLLGITVRVDERTRMEDDDDDDERRLTLDDINVGDFLEIRGSLANDDSSDIVARRLEREDDDDRDTALQGLVEDIAEPTLTILGVTVETNAGTEFEGRDDDDVSASEFFAGLAIGDLIKAEGLESSDRVIIAEEVEYEDD